MDKFWTTVAAFGLVVEALFLVAMGRLAMEVLPAGHVTGRGLSRSTELKLLGNGVVPQQAGAAWLELNRRRLERP